MKILYSLLLLLIVLSACNNSSKQIKNEEEKQDSTVVKKDSLQKDTSLTNLSLIILKQLKDKNYQSFAQHIHPKLGVRFSPYGYIDTKQDMVLKADQLLALIKDQQPLLWGQYDGTGEEIKLTIKEYFDKFVYDVNFLKAPKLTLNQVLAQGNSINNMKEVYPEADYTESYFPGFKKEYEGMDWRALRLVYQKYNGETYLVGIIHDQWTI